MEESFPPKPNELVSTYFASVSLVSSVIGINPISSMGVLKFIFGKAVLFFKVRIAITDSITPAAPSV